MGGKTGGHDSVTGLPQTFFPLRVRSTPRNILVHKSAENGMNRYGKPAEKSVKSDTRIAKQQMKSSGYGKDTSVAAEGGQEPERGIEPEGS